MTLPYQGRTVQRVSVDQSVIGQTDLLALQGGQRIYLVGAYIDLVAAGTLAFNSGVTPTAISGAVPIAANGGFVLPVNVENPWTYSRLGEKLGLVTTGVGALAKGFVVLMIGNHSTPDA